MKRDVGALISLSVLEPAELVFSIAVATGVTPATENLSFTLDGAPVEYEELTDAHGTRLQRLAVGAGSFEASYSASVVGRAVPEELDATDLIRYLRPSRYCESDTLVPTAVAEFSGVTGVELLGAVSSWVGTRLAYVSGSSLPTDGAVRTMLARQGVCRDYAHLCVALLRAMNVPARLAAVYAPGLYPMDFHAVAEAYVDDDWHVVDATTLAPRGTMLRISTGRDASDTAFLTTLSGAIELGAMTVTAVADVLPDDDVTKLDRLG
jgi:transglutaminase-like putative cysteine protease